MSRKIIEYFTAIDTDIKGLDKQVDSFVRDGYQPYGNPYVVPGEKTRICQAIVMFEEDSSGMKLSSENPL